MDELRKCQLLQLKIAVEIVKICEANDIPYLLHAGTLLGAVRHGGFIPWDDDMDIGMTRQNYNRFIEAAGKQLGEEYFLQTWDVEKEYAAPFAKVRLNGTEFVEKNCGSANIHKGIYVDVFPFDNVPDGKVRYKLQKYSAAYYKHLLMHKCRYDYIDHHNRKKAIASAVLRFLAKLYSTDYIHRRFLKVMTKYNAKKTGRLIAFGGSGNYEKETLNREWIEKLSPIRFEGHCFMGPEDYDGYLSHFYGDYMTPPPEDVRYQGHGIVRVSFGKYGD